MLVVLLALVHVASAIDVQVVGDVAFDVLVSNDKQGQKMWFRQGWSDARHAKDELVFKMMQVRQNMTVAPEVECVYQYPEKNQVNALLSNMMNQLTKVFVRASDFINELDEPRRSARPLRPEDSRFRVVGKKQKEFFEVIYANMTNEYSNFYNETVDRVDRAGRDPCQHQDEVKQIWRDLLEHSLQTLKKATHRCVTAYLEDQEVRPHAGVRMRLAQYLVRELGKVRGSQLTMLCDTYQLCYNDLL